MPIIDAGWVTKDGKWVATKDGQTVKCRRKNTNTRERIKERWEKKLLTQQKVDLKPYFWLNLHLLGSRSLFFLSQLSLFLSVTSYSNKLPSYHRSLKYRIRLVILPL